MKAGDLNKRVVLESRVETQNATTGEVSVSWAKVADLWAGIHPASVREFIAAGVEQSAVAGRIVIRYRPGVTPKMRIRHGGKIYNILGVLPDKETGREYLTLPYSEGVNEG